jgi:hypothetical protein
MIIEEEFDELDMYEDGSGPSEDIMIQRFYAKQADEAIENSKQYESPDDEITPWDFD